MVRDPLTAVIQERARREIEALRLYRPMPSQLAFHLSQASERVIRGGTRSGKSTAAAAEVASAACGMPIIGPDGKPLPFHYPTHYPLRIWIIGYDCKHIGQTLHRLLFKPGNFWVIRDEVTGLWRAYNPRSASDQKRADERRPSPAMIPSRLAPDSSFAWEMKAQRVFSSVRLTNGNEIFAYPSTGEPKQGDPVDLIWVDEDVEYPGHLQEWEDRLSDRKGRLIWSAFPHSKNNALLRLSERALEDVGSPHPDVSEFRLIFTDNPHIDDNEKRKRLKGRTEEEIRARNFGEFVESALVYPEFDLGIHGLRLDGYANETPIEREMRLGQGNAPYSWTHYVGIDPGSTKQAALIFSVPPPEFGQHLVLWHEIFAQEKNADYLAAQIKVTLGGREAEAFIIDGHAARATPMGHSPDERVLDRYILAFERQNLACRMTGASFIYGTDNVLGRTMKCREYMTIREDGRPRLLVVKAKLNRFLYEIGHYRKRVTKTETTDDPIRGNDDCMNAMEYVVAYEPEYIPQNPQKRRINPCVAFYKEWIKENQRESDTVHMGAGVTPF